MLVTKGSAPGSRPGKSGGAHCGRAGAKSKLNDDDADLGSTGPMLAPGTNLLIAGSKKGIVYLFDTAKLGHMTAHAEGVLQRFK